MPLNSLTTEWWDLTDCISAGSLNVLLQDGAPDDAKALLAQLKKESSKTIQNGASFRLAITADTDYNINLQFQSLPLALPSIKSRPLLSEPKIAVQIIHSWPITVDKFDPKSGLFGPIPAFFTENTGKALSLLSAHQDTLFRQLK